MTTRPLPAPSKCKSGQFNAWGHSSTHRTTHWRWWSGRTPPERPGPRSSSKRSRQSFMKFPSGLFGRLSDIHIWIYLNTLSGGKCLVVPVPSWATETVLSPWLAADEVRVSHVLSHVVWWKKKKKIYIYIYVCVIFGQVKKFRVIAPGQENHSRAEHLNFPGRELNVIYYRAIFL